MARVKYIGRALRGFSVRFLRGRAVLWITQPKECLRIVNDVWTGRAPI